MSKRRRNDRSVPRDRRSQPVLPVSRQELMRRRAELRRRRRRKVAFGGWRVLAAVAIAAATAWAIASPVWILQSSDAVRVEGNRTLDRTDILRLAALDYPQSLWRIQPQAIADALEARAPIAEASVRRQLLPPGLVVRVRELVPVAVLQVAAAAGPARGGVRQNPQLLLIDDRGRQIDFERYRALQPPPPLPSLKVVTEHYEQFQEFWPQLYAQVRLASVPIRELRWQVPNQLEIVTNVARVDCGPYGDRFVEQLETLARFGNLDGRVPPDRAAYIDLRDPDTPILDLRVIPATTPVPNAGTSNNRGSGSMAVPSPAPAPEAASP